MDISAIIKNIRLKTGLTQEKFAESIEISRSSLTQIETGKSNATLDILSKIIEVYNINPNVFFSSVANTLDETNSEKEINVNNFNILKKSISENDLELLKKNGWGIDFFDLSEFISYSENKIKAILEAHKKDLTEKIKTFNSICNIAKILQVSSEEYYRPRFAFIDEKEYLEEILNSEEDNKPYDNTKLGMIVLIFNFKASIEHITYLITNRIEYLEMGVEEKHVKIRT